MASPPSSYSLPLSPSLPVNLAANAEPAPNLYPLNPQPPSYLSKLVGHIPRVFENAFCLERGLDDDDSDDDVAIDMDEEKPGVL
ncbi:hypothetical protein CDL15_Pgr019329 [Punica granatum]|uniref:Uncharacterized protein n=1 Tax=Punica granatum TaxID=22663 RepID=A0A218X4K8_PUNGR|nr:hypothetical protein CDL15_Pgr019329 [Punica granatum]PKI54097.1 hypothetical protein CRG98_025513 [Punica granatum]